MFTAQRSGGKADAVVSAIPRPASVLPCWLFDYVSGASSKMFLLLLSKLRALLPSSTMVSRNSY